MMEEDEGDLALFGSAWVKPAVAELEEFRNFQVFRAQKRMPIITEQAP